MPLLSGQLPYQYATGGRPFSAGSHYGPNPIGISGILIEQAQFVATAELRKWLPGYTPNYKKYITQDETGINLFNPENYEPSNTDINLSEIGNPANASFIDHINETRTALDTLFGLLDLDSVGGGEYKKAWLTNAYPKSPSGTNGDWLRRLPSEVGKIDYTSLEVLGGSGILFDVDVGEIMFNPFPHLSAVATIFPRFQKTNGSLITLNGREDKVSNPNGGFFHIQSGAVAVNGYALLPTTSFYLSKNNFPDMSSVDFSYVNGGMRAPFGDNIDKTRIFLNPSPQTFGVYRLFSANHYFNNPFTAIESGVPSSWPNQSIDLNSQPEYDASLTNSFDGYHVFNDNIWIVNSYFNPSGLAILSPFTAEAMYLRGASGDGFIVPGYEFLSPPLTAAKTWKDLIGLEKVGSYLYRAHPLIERVVPGLDNGKGRFLIVKYDTNLNFINTILTTSSDPNGLNGAATAFGLGSDNPYQQQVNDICFDGSNFLISQLYTGIGGKGWDIWKFDSDWHYIGKYIVQVVPQLQSAGGDYAANFRLFSANGNVYIYSWTWDNIVGQIPGPPATIFNLGISRIIETQSDPEPFASNIVDGYGIYEQQTLKSLDESLIPELSQYSSSGIILDIQEISSSTHVQPGIYAIVQKMRLDNNVNYLFLMRIEEQATTWKVLSAQIIELGTTSVYSDSDIRRRRDINYMGQY